MTESDTTWERLDQLTLENVLRNLRLRDILTLMSTNKKIRQQIIILDSFWKNGYYKDFVAEMREIPGNHPQEHIEKEGDWFHYYQSKANKYLLYALEQTKTLPVTSISAPETKLNPLGNLKNLFHDLWPREWIIDVKCRKHKTLRGTGSLSTQLICVLTSLGRVMTKMIIHDLNTDDMVQFDSLFDAQKDNPYLAISAYQKKIILFRQKQCEIILFNNMLRNFGYIRRVVGYFCQFTQLYQGSVITAINQMENGCEINIYSKDFIIEDVNTTKGNLLSIVHRPDKIISFMEKEIGHNIYIVILTIKDIIAVTIVNEVTVELSIKTIEDGFIGQKIAIDDIYEVRDQGNDFMVGISDLISLIHQQDKEKNQVYIDLSIDNKIVSTLLIDTLEIRKKIVHNNPLRSMDMEEEKVAQLCGLFYHNGNDTSLHDFGGITLPRFISKYQVDNIYNIMLPSQYVEESLSMQIKKSLPVTPVMIVETTNELVDLDRVYNVIVSMQADIDELERALPIEYRRKELKTIFPDQDIFLILVPKKFGPGHHIRSVIMN